MPDWISHEPALWTGLVDAVIVLLVAFGVPVTPEQKTAVLGVTAAVLAILSAIFVRSQVTPVAKLKQAGLSVPR
jgi:hypothetical protein